MRLILFSLAMLFCSNSFAGQVAIDPSTKKIVATLSSSAGNLADHVPAGMIIVTNIPTDLLTTLDDASELKWTDFDLNRNPKASEIDRKSDIEITAMKTSQETMSIKKQIVDYTVKKKEAEDLGFTDVSSDLQKKINSLTLKLP